MFTEASVDETPSSNGGQIKGKSVENSYGGYTFHGFTYEPEYNNFWEKWSKDFHRKSDMIREEETAEDIEFVKHEGNRKEYHKISP